MKEVDLPKEVTTKPTNTVNKPKPTTTKSKSKPVAKEAKVKEAKINSTTKDDAVDEEMGNTSKRDQELDALENMMDEPMEEKEGTSFISL